MPSVPRKRRVCEQPGGSSERSPAGLPAPLLAPGPAKSRSAYQIVTGKAHSRPAEPGMALVFHVCVSTFQPKYIIGFFPPAGRSPPDTALHKLLCLCVL